LFKKSRFDRQHQGENVKKILVALVVAVIAYYGGRTLAAQQLAKLSVECMAEKKIPERLKSVTSEDDARTLGTEIVECIDKRKGFLASFFFNKNEWLNSVRVTKTVTRK
jgi:hypothetical protein